ncbi:MAG: lysine--tRNA ligase [Candidatus Dasytiphilus stammeri]
MCIHNKDSSLGEDNEFKIRRKKLNFLRKKGNAFPNDFRRNYTSYQLHAELDKKSINEIKAMNLFVSVAGRIMALRIMGKTSFVTLQDMDGQIQLYIRDELFSPDVINNFKKWDLGDIIGVSGNLFKTKTNELTINCTKIQFLTKALRPLPDKFHKLVDIETCYRQRYLDLIVNQKSRKNFILRSKIISAIRNFLEENNFLEVETPMMHTNHSGGARPFITHHHKLNMDMYLRIAPELYLKRLIIGGFERIFEINRNFRNEGISPKHNPEFTMMELYMAYADDKDLISLIETLFKKITKKLLGTTIIYYGKNKFDFSKPFMKLTMKEAIYKYCPKNFMTDFENPEETIKIAKLLGIDVRNNWGHGRILTKIFEKIIEENLISPTFITDYPTEVSPLARSKNNNKFISDRFELFINGFEICNGFSELNDADEQTKRFRQQSQQSKYLLDDIDNDIMFYDKDYIRAMEYGMPPTAGLGLGIDRFIMILTNNHNIRDVILFPTLRPQN